MSWCGCIDGRERGLISCVYIAYQIFQIFVVTNVNLPVDEGAFCVLVEVNENELP